MRDDMDLTSYKMFLTFIKNTESMVETMHTSGGFAGNLSAQIGVIDDMIKAMEILKIDLANQLQKDKNIN